MCKDFMKLIEVQPYFKIKRYVSSLEQKNVEETRNIYLYDHKIVTKHREFPIEQVMDMSYRKFGKMGGLLYLHTTRGVYSYNVKSSPQSFIETFKNHVKTD